MTSASLQRRLTLGMLTYMLLLSLAVAAHGLFVNENVEAAIWNSLLQSEHAYFRERMSSDPEYRWTDTELLQLYGHGSTHAIPREFDLPPGTHDEIALDERQYVALVTGTGDARSVMALDITAMEAKEMEFVRVILVSSAAIVLVLTLLTYLGVARLVRPLTSLARSIHSLLPDRSGQRIAVEARAPREARIIARSVNTYLARNDEYVERERHFIRMASHELRTPIAVLISSAEVALDQQAMERPVESHLQRIIATANEMQDTVALLLVLARDPQRLRSMMEPVDLVELLDSVVQDHRVLAGARQLHFDLVITAPCTVQAPRQILAATIGNLVRNAIENSEHGTIRVHATASQVVVEDPGHGLSDAERGRIYTQLARAGVGDTRGGIGIELISRACAHLGWHLDVESPPAGGTRATLHFSRPQPA